MDSERLEAAVKVLLKIVEDWEEIPFAADMPAVDVSDRGIEALTNLDKRMTGWHSLLRAAVKELADLIVLVVVEKSEIK